MISLSVVVPLWFLSLIVCEAKRNVPVDDLAHRVFRFMEGNDTTSNEPIDYKRFSTGPDWTWNVTDKTLANSEGLHDGIAHLFKYFSGILLNKQHVGKFSPEKVLKDVATREPNLSFGTPNETQTAREYLAKQLPAYFVVKQMVDNGCPRGLLNTGIEFPNCFIKYFESLNEEGRQKFGLGITSMIADFAGSAPIFDTILCPILAERLALESKTPEFCRLVRNLLEASNVCLQLANIQSVPEGKAWTASHSRLFCPDVEYEAVLKAPDIEIDQSSRRAPNSSPPPIFSNDIKTRLDNAFPISPSSTWPNNTDLPSTWDREIVETWRFLLSLRVGISRTLMAHWYNHPSHKWLQGIPFWTFFLIETDFLLRSEVDRGGG